MMLTEVVLIAAVLTGLALLRFGLPSSGTWLIGRIIRRLTRQTA